MFRRNAIARAVIGALAGVTVVAACAPVRPGSPDPARQASSHGPQKAEGQTIAEMFAGKFPGVQVFPGPGGGVTLRIRNAGTIYNKGEPLIIVDGTRLMPGTGGLLLINPADIDTIEVLKDAASASFYGLQGANGVVLITTKRSL